jgi:hypothetical protein
LEVIKGEMKRNKLYLVQAWMEIHREDLMANWKLLQNHEPAFRIDPLR